METAIGLIGGAVLATLITLAGTYYFWVLQRSRKELGYEILSANVIIPKLPKKEAGIQVMVKASLLSGHAEGMQEYRPVETILGFRVRVRNTGNQVLENQAVTFTLDENARIISIEPEKAPDLGGRQIESVLQQPRPNVATATMPFLNPGQEVIFSLQSVDNAGDGCTVTAGAPGLRYFDMEHRAAVVLLCSFLTIGLILTSPLCILGWVKWSGHISAVNAVMRTLIALSGTLGLVLLVFSVMMFSAWLFAKLAGRPWPDRRRRRQ